MALPPVEEEARARLGAEEERRNPLVAAEEVKERAQRAPEVDQGGAPLRSRLI